MSKEGKLQDLNEGRNEALRALLNSITSEVGQHPDAVKRLSEKLGELVGEDAVKGFDPARNERGELVNEEGLPIIEIAEPIVTTADLGSGNALLADEDELAPLSSYPPFVRERWRKERERILDLLEEEEHREQAREERLDEEQRQDILRKRREAAANEKAKMKAAKEMEKKLGKALLRDMAGTRENQDNDRQKTISDKKDETKQNHVKKTVAFADLPNDAKPSRPGTAEEWGDVTPARLRSTSGPSLLSSEKHPMKLTVVERHPASQTTYPPTVVAGEPDSDDESELGSPGDLEQQPNLHQFPVDHDDNHPLDSDVDENLVLEDEDFDVDFTQHQREIALQYYERRSTVSEVASAAMRNHSHSEDEDRRTDILLDAPSPVQPKPSLSRFKADRIAASYNASTSSSSPSTSLGASVSSTRTLQRAIRAGKLVDERLVGGDADSASEEENEGIQEVLDLLRKGEVYNLGPDGNYIHAPARASSNESPSGTSSLSLATASNLQPSPLPTLHRPRTSKFKLSRSQPGRPPAAVATPLSSNRSSRDHTPVSRDDQSSPKVPPAMTPIVVERLPLTSSLAKLSLSSAAVHMNMDSPSPSVLPPISAPTSGAPANTTPGSQTFSTSTVIETPISTPRGSTAIGVPSNPHHATSRPSRPPTIIAAPRKPPTDMSAAVQDSDYQRIGPTDTPPKREKKVSRFMAERM